MVRTLVIGGVVLALAGCGGAAEPNLLNIKQVRGDGPDEFAIVPTKPLVLPEDLAALPAPTPGGANLTDPTPEADAAQALGGNIEVLTRGSTDGGLIAYTTRYGVNPQIRAELAAADLQWRRDNDGRLLERWFSVNVYFRAYEPFELDQYAELERLRRAGIRTSAAPPDPAREE